MSKPLRPSIPPSIKAAMLRGLSLYMPHTHVSDDYALLDKAQKKWARRLRRLDQPHGDLWAVSIPNKTPKPLSQETLDENAKGLRSAAHFYTSFIAPIAFDEARDCWCAAFGDPRHAMLFKLAYGGEQ